MIWFEPVSVMTQQPCQLWPRTSVWLCLISTRPPSSFVDQAFVGVWPLHIEKKGGGGIIEGEHRLHVQYVCAVGVLISKCWRFTGLSCFLSPANPTTQKPLWSRGSRQLAMTRHVQHWWGGLDRGPILLLASAASSLWHNRNAHVYVLKRGVRYRCEPMHFTKIL